MQELSNILTELRNQATKPLAIHIDGTLTYVVYGSQTFSGAGVSITGYPILRISTPDANSTILDNGLLLESDRNGVDLKNDYVNFLLLMIGVSFG
jgi:hypothetical protein